MDEHIPILGRIRGRANAAGARVLFQRPAGQSLLHLKLSIRDKILMALLIVVLLMSVRSLLTGARSKSSNAPRAAWARSEVPRET